LVPSPAQSQGWLSRR